MDTLKLLNSIHPYYYDLLPLFVILIFEIVVVILEVVIMNIFWKVRFKRGDTLNQDDGIEVSTYAIIVGNIITFLIGIVIFFLLGGSL